MDGGCIELSFPPYSWEKIFGNGASWTERLLSDGEIGGSVVDVCRPACTMLGYPLYDALVESRGSSGGPPSPTSLCRASWSSAIAYLSCCSLAIAYICTEPVTDILSSWIGNWGMLWFLCPGDKKVGAKSVGERDPGVLVVAFWL